jgi:DnaK suppressor protein
MNKRDLKHFEKLLLAERNRLGSSIRTIEDASRSGYGREHGADLSSFAESGTDNFELETALNIAGAESEHLIEVCDALDRIRKGTYGICEGSGNPIPRKRLEAFPAARYCIEHQAELEKENTMRR